MFRLYFHLPFSISGGPRSAKLTQTQDELAQTKAHVEVLVMKNHESDAKAEALTKENEKLSLSLANLEAFRNIVLVIFVIAAMAYVGRALICEAS